MKLLILIAIVITGTVFLAPTQKNIAGTWVLDTEGKKCETTILHIQMAEGYYAGRLDIPGQQVYDKPVSIRLEKDRIKIRLDEKASCFIEAVVTDSLLTGRSVVAGKAEPVKFYRAKN
jgi:hypothetical protein